MSRSGQQNKENMKYFLNIKIRSQIDQSFPIAHPHKAIETINKSLFFVVKSYFEENVNSEDVESAVVDSLITSHWLLILS